jgi:hypothetical protein
MLLDNKMERLTYYQKNKERMNRIARERYQKKRQEPEFYQSVLEKNQKAYYKKTHKILTQEEEEAYFQKIKKDIATLPAKNDPSDFYKQYTYQEIQEMFFMD